MKGRQSSRGECDESDKSESGQVAIPDLLRLEREATSAIEPISRCVLDKRRSEITTKSAAWKLHRLAVFAVAALGKVAAARPSHLRPIAETSEAWPAFVSWHGDYAKSHSELMGPPCLLPEIEKPTFEQTR